MTNLTPHRLFAAAALLLAASLTGCTSGSHNPYDLGPAHNVAGATGNQILATGVPNGGWHCQVISNNFNNRVTVNGTLDISAQGVARFQTSFDCAYKPGYRFGAGKFAGRTRVFWTTTSTYRKVARVGHELYCYPDAGSRTQLLGGNPPGYSLNDYQTLGGMMSAGQSRDTFGADNGVTIFEIRGRDLVLATSTDARRWLYQRSR